MKELEIKTYNFAVQSIGFAKSIEKEFPEINIKDFKSLAGAVSIKFIDAFDAKENDSFAQNLRECHQKTKESLSILNSISDIKNPDLEKQKQGLIQEGNLIDQDLEKIIQKLIY